MTEPRYEPRVMHHPAHRKSQSHNVDVVADGGGRYYGKMGDAERFPPVTVSSKAQEEYHRSLGYRMPGEAVAALAFAIYPMWMKKAGAEDMLVKDDAEQAMAERDGYIVPGTPDRDAFERQAANPHIAGRVHRQYPMYDDDGNVVDDPAAPGDGPVEYPKWVGDVLVKSAAEEVALLGKAASPDKLTRAAAIRDKARAAAETARLAAEAAEAELAGLLGAEDQAPADVDPVPVAAAEKPKAEKPRARA